MLKNNPTDGSRPPVNHWLGMDEINWLDFCMGLNKETM